MLSRSCRLRVGLLLVGLVLCVARCVAATDFRPPAVPLVAHDPYLSIWSGADRLTDVETSHWSGHPQPLHSAIRVDGAIFRLMGAEPARLPALPQDGVEVLPTRTIYRFSNAQVAVTLTFLTPALPAKLDVLARPLTYLRWDVAARDGRTHEVALSFDASALLAVASAEQVVEGAASRGEGWRALSTGTVEQPVLEKEGDDITIDWGHAYVVASDPAWQLGFAAAGGGGFGGATADEFRPQPAAQAPVLCAWRTLGAVATTPARATLMLAYDDGVSIRYFDAVLKPYWRRDGLDAGGLFTAAGRDGDRLSQECAAFDARLMSDLTAVGGEPYARLAALAYRQTIAGCKLAADAGGAPLFFPKENQSGGCVGTVDVLYPMLPLFYVLSPTLARAALVPALDYGASPRWKFPYAPHDLGCYPHATGQFYGGGEVSDERQMPVEESANMILLVAGLQRADGRSDLAEHYWPQLERWARYLEQKGFDPENQLCTDDFAGHLAHNVNLSAKAIVALGAFGQLCAQRGQAADAAHYGDLARRYAGQWEQAARAGDHYRLAFDRPDTWSQKYNLVWDRVLGLGLFSPATLRREMDFYLAHASPYGLPLDSRATYTKLDWTVWTAALTGVRADQDALVAGVYRFVNSTPDRAPMADWYFTDTAKLQIFRARPVVGGVFMPLLCDAPRAKAWAARSERFNGSWAPLPLARYATVVSTGDQTPTTWRYATTAPGASWAQAEFPDATWTSAAGGFYSAPADSPRKAPPANLVLPARWARGELWARHAFTVGEMPATLPRLRVTHSGTIEVYLNGKLALREPGMLRGYETLALRPEAVAALRRGENVIAFHLLADAPADTAAYVDVGMVVPRRQE